MESSLSLTERCSTAELRLPTRRTRSSAFFGGFSDFTTANKSLFAFLLSSWILAIKSFRFSVSIEVSFRLKLAFGYFLKAPRKGLQETRWPSTWAFVSLGQMRNCFKTVLSHPLWAYYTTLSAKSQVVLYQLYKVEGLIDAFLKKLKPPRMHYSGIALVDKCNSMFIIAHFLNFVK